MASRKSNVHAFSRMNYLYQAASMCLETPTDQSVRVAAYYGALLRTIGKRTLCRMDPSMKRTLCKGCHALLVPGITATVRLKKRPAAQVTWLCKCCATIKRFNLRKDYKIWVEHEEAVVAEAGSNTPKSKNIAVTSGSKTGKFETNKCKQSKTTVAHDVTKISLVPDGKSNKSATDIEGHSTSLFNIVKPTKKTSDIALANKVSQPPSDVKQCIVDSRGELKDSASDIDHNGIEMNEKTN